MSPVVKPKREKFTLPSKYLLFILTIICCLMMVITFTTDVFNKPLNYVVGYIIVPYQKGISSIGSYFSEKKDALVNVYDLLNENANLRNRIAELEEENTRLLQDKYELNTLRELYELDQTYDSYTKVGARVIFRDSGNWFSTFIVDKGYKDGITPNMNVICGNGLVGRVSVVGPNWAQITSIISDNSNVSATVINTQDNIIVSGDLASMDNNVILFSQLIDEEQKVTKGDKIVTSDISDKYLPGILIGYISDIADDPNNLTRSGTILPAVDFEHIEEVLIILDMKQSVSDEELKNGYNSLNFSDEILNEEEGEEENTEDGE